MILDGYIPEEAFVFNHDGERWFSDRHLMVPMRCRGGFPKEVGAYRWDGALGEYVADRFFDFGSFCREGPPKLLGAAGPLARPRRQRVLYMTPAEGRDVTLFLRIEPGLYVNRLLLDIAEAFAAREVIGFSKSKPSEPVALYAAEGFVGLLMPAYVPAGCDIVRLGIEQRRVA